ncbi:TolC family protein [Aliiglaciecola litoralis]|uniref:TolC family protein n=1 Tax=Aliiglaciecola litoralis TaxID=582857 RepID=A0ABN1LC41_9ALTE
MCPLKLTVLMSAMIITTANANGLEALSIDKAITLAIQNDPWLAGNKYRETAIRENSVAANTYPEPVVSVGVANLPVDGFVFNQEPMTQLKFGVSQMLPKGDSLAIRSQQLQQTAQQFPFQREDRIAQLRMTVSSLWFDVYRAQQSIQLIEQDRQLFAQLGEIAQVNYSSALGNVRQQDIVRAQLELSRLDDRLTGLRAQERQASALLMEWIVQPEQQWQLSQSLQVKLDENLNQITPIPEQTLNAIAINDQRLLGRLLQAHPSIMSIEQRISASDSSIELAKQDYQPQWGLNASYAYRADDSSGASRADFFSIGVTVQVPLFTSNKQDRQVSAAVNEKEAMKTDKLLMLRSMMYKLQSAYAEYQGLKERQQLYKNAILVQMREQAEASLTAYTNDDGDFAEVVRARIADLNARLDALNIQTNLLKARVQIQYFLTQSTIGLTSPMEQLP